MEKRLNVPYAVIPGETYRHFKGHIIKVLAVASHTEKPETLVIYREIGKKNDKGLGTWARPLDMFISKVDKDKYPDATQEYRFELVPSVEFVEDCVEPCPQCTTPCVYSNPTPNFDTV